MEILKTIIIIFMAIFSQTESHLNLTQIEEAEKFIGLNFPNEYKEHLLQNNGGQCAPNIFKFNENGRWTESCVDWFLAIHDGEYDNLKEYVRTYKVDEKRLPIHILPIAHDPGGNLICISCGKQDEGQIYFWNHEQEVDYNLSEDTDYTNLYFVAKSFNEFIAGLKDELV
jgi:cell wall assembly regulator SMI1